MMNYMVGIWVLVAAGVVFASLWLFDTFGDFDDIGIVRQAMMWSGRLVVVLVLLTPAAFALGFDWFIDWKTEQILEDWGPALSKLVEPPTTTTTLP